MLQTYIFKIPLRTYWASDLLGFKSLINSKKILAIVTLRIASSSWPIFFLKTPLSAYGKSLPVLLASSAQLSPVAQSCLTLYNPMDSSTPGLPVHHQLPEFTQIHIHWVDDAIQSSHPLSSPSPAFNLSQHQGLFQMSQFFTSDGQSIGVSASASVLLMNIHDWSPLG